MLQFVEAAAKRLARNFANRWAHRLRVIEAVLLLAMSAAAQRWLPMPTWSRLIGMPAPAPAEWRGEQIEALPLRWASSNERKAARAVERAGRLVPWEPKCLAEATAGQLLLRQLGSPGVVVIGLRPADGERVPSWDAHAWLLGSRGALTGGRAARGFTATTVFQVPGALAADQVYFGPPVEAGGSSSMVEGT